MLEPDRRHRPWAIALRGIAMGAADLVPGVSGGTMALVLGIYRRLIAALGAITAGPTWRALLAGRLGEAWRSVDGGFLAALATGIAVAIVALPRVLHGLLQAYPVSVYAVFFGLIAASVGVVVRRIRSRRRVATVFAVVGAVFAFVLVGLVPAATPDTPAMLVLSGTLAVSALLLPGVSGAFILVLLGKYEEVLAAVSGFDTSVLVPLGLGMVIGLLGFSRLLATMLARWPASVLGVLAGFLAGSLRKVWPWQRLEGARSVAELPPGAWEAAVAAALVAIAIGVVVAIERASSSEPVGRSPGEAAATETGTGTAADDKA
ncbi:MAG: DUF368 domain-containing protein [Trueperaceae bacterium]|nr:DUF368 domain-containing protein [Trueperaceae bacterium]